MKKYNYLLLLSAVTASTAFTSCNEDRLDIPQKGVASIEDFYKTDADAESALVTVYSDTYDNYSFMGDVTGWNYSPYIALTNWMADDVVMPGSGEGDCEPERQYHDFRYNTDLNILEAGYKAFYRSIHKCNLLLNNTTPDSDVKKRCIAEAQVMRAFNHLLLAIYWGTPPIVTTVLTAADQPENSESQEFILKWVVDEIDAALALNALDKAALGDKNSRYHITEGFANAVKGKALLWLKDWAGAKAALKKVISSGAYKLVDDMQILGHHAGQGCDEIVFEFNLAANKDGLTNLGNRGMGNYPYLVNWRYEFFKGLQDAGSDPRLNMNGWGWISPSKVWADALIANDGMDSKRRQAWIKTYEEVLYDIKWPSDGDDWTPGKTDFKAKDKSRGLSPNFGSQYYGCCGYFPWKTVMHDPADNSKLNWCGTWDANYTIMRYAEVLLMYAEACAQSGDNDGLQYLNQIQTRAGSKHISSSLTLQEVKNEKWFEMWQDGCRAADQIRWGDVENLKTADHTIYILKDAIDQGAAEHKAVITVDAGSTFKSKGAGFQTGKHELLPFPYKVLTLNPNLKQNPGWE